MSGNLYVWYNCLFWRKWVSGDFIVRCAAPKGAYRDVGLVLIHVLYENKTKENVFIHVYTFHSICEVASLHYSGRLFRTMLMVDIFTRYWQQCASLCLYLIFVDIFGTHDLVWLTSALLSTCRSCCCQIAVSSLIHILYGCCCIFNLSNK